MPFPAIYQTWATSRAFFELKLNERLSRSPLEARKLRQFRRLVVHAARHPPYYPQLIQERGIEIENCKPADLPVLTKTELMVNFGRIVTDRRDSRQSLEHFPSHSAAPNERLLGTFQVVHTSGLVERASVSLFA